MRKKSRIKLTPTEHKSSLIKPTKINDMQKVSFNFKCLTAKENKFKYETQEKEYFYKLMGRLRDVSRMTRNELIIPQGNPNSLRCHIIDFSKTSEPSFGLPDEEELFDDAWQFEISKSFYGRIHGYFVGNVFYIVWLDPDHELYPKKK